MKPFPTPEKVWPDGQTRWHVYVVPEARDIELARLLHASEQVALEVAGDALVPTGEYAHATAQQISIPAADVSAEKLSAFIDALRHETSALKPFTVTVGNSVATTGAVLADVDQDLEGEPWFELNALVRRLVGQWFGEQALAYFAPPPHITIAYCAKDTDSGVITSHLRRRVRPAHAPMTVDAVWVLDVTQNVEDRTYTWPWQSAVRIPFGSAS